MLVVYEKYTWCHVEVYYPFFAILYIKSVVSEYQFCILVNKMKWILQPDSVLKTFFVFSQYLILCYISFSFIGDLDLILYLCCIWIMCLFGIYMGLAVGLNIFTLCYIVQLNVFLIGLLLLLSVLLQMWPTTYRVYFLKSGLVCEWHEAIGGLQWTPVYTVLMSVQPKLYLIMVYFELFLLQVDWAHGCRPFALTSSIFAIKTNYTHCTLEQHSIVALPSAALLNYMVLLVCLMSWPHLVTSALSWFVAGLVSS